MKRLKIDLEIFDNYKYEKWGEKEFNFISPYIRKVIKVYMKYLSMIEMNKIEV
jgi:hypothetical protein